ncbi:Protein of unknown function [Pyronema omphalodes CBS 100304]|uniref:Uncharacterized protein n=1 Tax=Pyronema omphalodes (strain CBS 100304) TaxID=1076935 RepID=U4LMZ8_PYROM|nr:Protein of unknown function [Pyronema omphalodes CBS 100304]
MFITKLIFELNAEPHPLPHGLLHYRPASRYLHCRAAFQSAFPISISRDPVFE